MISLSSISNVGISSDSDWFTSAKEQILLFSSSGEMASFIKQWYAINFPKLKEQQIQNLLSLHIYHLKSRLLMLSCQKKIYRPDFNRLISELSFCENYSESSYKPKKECFEYFNTEILIAIYLACQIANKKMPSDFIDFVSKKILVSHREFSLDLLCEMKSDLVSRLFQTSGPTVSHPFLKDPLFRKGNIDYIRENYSFDELRTIFYKEVPRMYKRFSTQLFAECQFLAQNITIDDYLEIEMKRPLSFAYFNQSLSTSNSNPAILHYIFNLYRRNANKELEPFSIF